MISSGTICDECAIALAAQEVLIYGQDFYFCQHCYNELEATLISLDPDLIEKEDIVTADL